MSRVSKFSLRTGGESSEKGVTGFGDCSISYVLLVVCELEPNAFSYRYSLRLLYIAAGSLRGARRANSKLSFDAFHWTLRSGLPFRSKLNLEFWFGGS